jgi:alcohol dehydrogenase
MTAFAAVTEHGRVGAGDWVAVHGCGGVGLSALMIATALGASVVAVDVDDETLALARSLGAVHTVNGRDPVAEIVALTGGGAHVSLDALGSAATCGNSIRCLRKRGRHVQVGLMLEDDRTAPIPMDRVISYELELRGVHGMAVGHYDALLRLVTSGAVEPAKLIGRTIGLADAGEELAAMGEFAQRGVTVIEL